MGNEKTTCRTELPEKVNQDTAAARPFACMLDVLHHFRSQARFR